MNLIDRIKDIQQEYKQYAYVEHPPKKSDNPTEYENMMQQIYDRKKVLSDILKAYKGKKLEDEGEELENRLNDSDAYFSSITEEEKNNHNRFFDGVDVKVKETPEFQSYHMIYMNLMNSHQLQKTHSTASQAITKAKEKQKEASDNRDVLKGECSKEVMDSLMNISKDIAGYEENIVEINRQRRALERTTSQQLQNYNKQQEELNKKLEKPREKLKIFDISDETHRLNVYYVKYNNMLKNKNTYEEYLKEYTLVYNSYDKLYFRHENAMLKRSSDNLRTLNLYRNMTTGKDYLNLLVSRSKGREFPDTNMKVSELIADDTYDSNYRDLINHFFLNFYVMPSDEYLGMTVGEMLNLVEKLDKECEEIFGQDFKDLNDLSSLLHGMIDGSNWTWEDIEERVVRLGLLPDGTTADELRNDAKENYLRPIRDKAALKMNEVKSRIDEKCKKLEEALPEADKSILAEGEELRELLARKEELLDNMRGLWKLDYAVVKPLDLKAKIPDMLERMKQAEKPFVQDIYFYLRGFLTYGDMQDNTGEHFTNKEIAKIADSDLEYAFNWLNSKMDPVKAEMAEPLKQLAEINANIEALQNNKEQKLNEFAKAEAENQAVINNKPEDVAKFVQGEKLTNAAAAFVKANAEVMKTQKEVSAVVSDKMSQDFEEYKVEAEKWLKKIELHAKGHKNSTEFVEMMQSVVQFIESNGEPDKMQAAIEAMQAKSQKYLEEKHKQHRPFATDMRKTRLMLGESINSFSENALKIYSAVDEVNSIDTAFENKAEIDAVNENEANQLEDEAMERK